MTAIVTGHDGRPYRHCLAPRETVFVAEQRHHAAPQATPHTGLALLLGWLDPVQDGVEPLARIRLPTGGLIDVAARHVAPATNIAAVRVMPRPPARRTA